MDANFGNGTLAIGAEDNHAMGYAVRPRLVIPPRDTNFDNKPRRVGIEIEFAAVTARQAAEQIAADLDGTIEEVDPHRFKILGTRLGDFKCELDSRLAHPESYRLTQGPFEDWDWMRGLRGLASRSFGDVGSLIIPCEIVTPPLKIADVAVMDDMLESLRRLGARGTRDSVFYAFGVHLNPDLATVDPAWICDVLKAEMLLSDWLRAVMAIDASRNVSGFAEAFDEDYVRRVLAPGYRPETPQQLIDDYLRDNPTRDRELDMLPILAWLDEPRVRQRLPTEKIGKRPAFQFRLPNAALDEPAWSLSREWNRWVLIEQLAEDRMRLDAMAAAYLRNLDRVIPEDWAIRTSEWVVDLLQQQGVEPQQ